jgi:hypothetical protein
MIIPDELLTTDLTVRIGTDFDTLQQAFDAVAHLRVTHGTRIKLVHDDGYLIQHETKIGAGNFGHIDILSEAGPVLVSEYFAQEAPAPGAEYATFNGAYLTRGADFTGNADGKQLTIAARLEFTGGDGVRQDILDSRNASIGINLSRQTNGKLGFQLRDVSGGSSPLAALILGSTDLNVASGLVDILISVNLATGQGRLRINGVDDAATVSLQNVDADLTKTQHAIGASTDGSNKLQAKVHYIWMDRSYFDFDVQAEREKFGDLGEDGEGPTGSAPMLYLAGLWSAWHTNKGYGNGLSLNGGTLGSSGGGGGVVPEKKIIYAEHCIAPVLGCLIDGQHHAFQGLELYGAQGLVLPGCGIKNVEETCLELDGCASIVAVQSIFSGGTVNTPNALKSLRGVEVDGGCRAELHKADLRFCKTALTVQRGAICDAGHAGGDLYGADCSGFVNKAIIVNNGGIVNFQAGTTQAGSQQSPVVGDTNVSSFNNFIPGQGVIFT